MNGNHSNDYWVSIFGTDNLANLNQHPNPNGSTGGGTKEVLREVEEAEPIQENGELQTVPSGSVPISHPDWVPDRGTFWIILGFVSFCLMLPVGTPAPVSLKIAYAIGWGLVSFPAALLIYRLAPNRTRKEQELRAQRLAIRKKRQQRDKLIKKEAKRITRKAMSALARIGFARVKEGDRGMIKTYSKVKPEAIVCTRDSVGIKISSRTPMGVRFVNMATPDVASDLALRLQRGVWWEGWREDYEYGLWLWVALESGTMGISKLFPWHHKVDPFNALEKLPKTKKYAFMVGITKGQKPIYTSLPDLPHLGIFGATDTGKSVFMNQIICTLIKRHSPKELGLILIDMKRVELADYDDIPHLLRPRISDMSEVSGTIYWLLNEMNRRYGMIEGEARNIKEWNRQHPYNKLKRIALIIDEWAAVMLNKDSEFKSEVRQIEAMLTRIVQEARAVGIHCILTTQVPKSSIMEGLLMANITNRMVFQMGDIRASKMALDTSESARIPDDPGRGIWKAGPNKIDVKAPLITSEQIRATIEAAKKAHHKPPEVDPVEILQFGLSKGDRLSDPIVIEFGKHSGMGVDPARDMVKGMDYNIITKKPVFYLGKDACIVAKLGTRGRKILGVFADNLPESENEIEEIYKRQKAQEKAQKLQV